jgi:N utilization substance protein B
MISRRNIRVKVMQTLYALPTETPERNQADGAKQLKQKFEQSLQLFGYLLYFITETARYAEIDAHSRAGKHLPSAEDLQVNTKIAGNQWIWKLIDHTGFQHLISNGHYDSIIDRELLKRIYLDLIQTETYQEYILEPSRNPKEEKNIIDFIINQVLLPNESFIQHLEELFIHWDDDAEQMQTLIGNYLSKPNSFNFQSLVSEEKMKFATGLLKTVIEKSEQTLDLIKPKLKNWDADRIASLDLIMLQMGVCEFLYFETIPTKVTINEYIDLAKAYSTTQSGQFVNGLLDTIHKELVAENKIEKRSHREK